MTYVSTVLADGAVGLWELGEASTASAAADQAGNQNGVYNNGTAALVLGQTGIPGGGGATSCLSSAATTSGSYVSIASNAAQQLGDTFTLELWLKRVHLGAAQVGIGPVTNGGPAISFDAGNTISIVKAGVSVLGTTAGTYTDTTNWHHVVWTKNGATNHLYFDGADITPTVTNQTITNASGWLLLSRPAGSFTIGAYTAMFALYPTVLSPATVANHYTIGSTAPATSGMFMVM